MHVFRTCSTRRAVSDVSMFCIPSDVVARRVSEYPFARSSAVLPALRMQKVRVVLISHVFSLQCPSLTVSGLSRDFWMHPVAKLAFLITLRPRLPFRFGIVHAPFLRRFTIKKLNWSSVDGELSDCKARGFWASRGNNKCNHVECLVLVLSSVMLFISVEIWLCEALARTTSSSTSSNKKKIISARVLHR